MDSITRNRKMQLGQRLTLKSFYDTLKIFLKIPLFLIKITFYPSFSKLVFFPFYTYKIFLFLESRKIIDMLARIKIACCRYNCVMKWFISPKLLLSTTRGDSQRKFHPLYFVSAPTRDYASTTLSNALSSYALQVYQWQVFQGISVIW